MFTKKTINYTGRVEGLDKKINFLAIPPDVYTFKSMSGWPPFPQCMFVKDVFNTNVIPEFLLLIPVDFIVKIIYAAL